MDLNKIPKKNSKIVARKTGSEYVLVPVRDNIVDMEAVYTLNETGAFIWEQINGIRNVEEIIDSITMHYNIDKATATEDVYSFINNMSKYLIVKE